MSKHSYHFGIVSATMSAFKSVKVERHIWSRFCALMAPNFDLFVFDLFRQLIFCLFYLLVNQFYCSFIHFLIGQATTRTIDIFQHRPTFYMNQMPAFHWDVALGWKMQLLETNRTTWTSHVVDAFMLADIRNTVTAFVTMCDSISGSSSAHFTQIAMKNVPNFQRIILIQSALQTSISSKLFLTDLTFFAWSLNGLTAET